LYVEPENLLNPASLEWVLEAIQYPLVGADQYPTLAEKSALLAWTIIKNHVFNDVNKRTGMSSLEILLRYNEFGLEATPDEIVETAIKIAQSRESNYSYEDLVQWTRNKMVIIRATDV
jgi:death-on-curing protein